MTTSRNIKGLIQIPDSNYLEFKKQQRLNHEIQQD